MVDGIYRGGYMNLDDKVKDGSYEMVDKVFTGNVSLDDRIREWLDWNRNDDDLRELEMILRQYDKKVLEKLFLHRLCFGTAGLRGRMGCGYAQLNDLVILQTTQGLLKWISCRVESERGSKPKVVIGYDGRRNSKRFAELAATVFVNGGCKVYLFSEMVPTPFVSFGTELLADVGIMITASHNPKEDNGYKVYYKHGIQINTPHDKEIENLIKENLETDESLWDTSVLHKSKLVTDPLAIVKDAYYSKLWNGPYDPESEIKITYTAMHGVGYPFIIEAFEKSGLKPVIPVKEQVDPDPDFPTVKFPNPEEGKCALNLSIETANTNGATIILANDPDADRLAVAEKGANGEWKVFNGNELGALLGWWCLHVEKTTNPKYNAKNVYFLSSSVSSKILRTIADIEGCNFEETLTGFKWLGKRAYEISTVNDNNPIFAFEEAIGFMCGTAVKDKDGISAAVCTAKLATYLKRMWNLTLQEQLSKIYDLYGHHLSNNSYLICKEPETTKKIFNRLCHYDKDAPNTYPTGLLNEKYKIRHVRDLILAYDSMRRHQNYLPKLPVSKTSPMITFYFTNGLVATLRASGTEPKIKYYTELCAAPEEKDINSLRSTQTEMVQAIIEEFLEPELNGLLWRSD